MSCSTRFISSIFSRISFNEALNSSPYQSFKHFPFRNALEFKYINAIISTSLILSRFRSFVWRKLIVEKALSLGTLFAVAWRSWRASFERAGAYGLCKRISKGEQAYSSRNIYRCHPKALWIVCKLSPRKFGNMKSILSILVILKLSPPICAAPFKNISIELLLPFRCELFIEVDWFKSICRTMDR